MVNKVERKCLLASGMAMWNGKRGSGWPVPCIQVDKRIIDGGDSFDVLVKPDSGEPT